MIRQLQANKYIERLFIKPHPSADLNEISIELSIPIETRIPEYAHVAIVGNSSVSLELALNKILVLQDFKLDTIMYDYYGFARDGLTSEIHYEQIAGRFWSERKVDKQFIDAVTTRLLDESGIGEHSELKHFFKTIAIGIGGGLIRGEPIEEVINKYLRFYPQTFFSLMKGAGLNNTKDFSLLKALDTLFNERRLDIGACYEYIEASQCRSVVDFWFLAKQVEWSGVPFTSESAYNSFSDMPVIKRHFRGWSQNSSIYWSVPRTLPHYLSF
jgi:hypothetical protein